MSANTFRTVLVAAILGVLAGALLPNALASHRAECLQHVGGSGPDTFYGSDTQCDEFWTWAGGDTVWAYGPSTYQDEGHLDVHADTAHAGRGPDSFWLGDNGPGTTDIGRGGDGNDYFYDNAGPDKDDVCTGQHLDEIRVNDDDFNDRAYGEQHEYGHPDVLYYDNNGSGSYDDAQQDLLC